MPHWCFLMLNVVKSSFCTAQSEPVRALASQPAFRKATEAMRLAYYVCNEVLNGVDDRENLFMIVGSAYGEIGMTKDFLFDLYKSQLARPTPFQNSLHNAILGFLSIQLKVKGPGISLSHGAQTPRDLLEVAQTFLATGEANRCLVCYVDSYMDEFRRQAHFVPDEPTIPEGASALLLSRQVPAPSSIQEENHFYSWLKR